MTPNLNVLENLDRERENSLAETYPKSLGRMLKHLDLTMWWVIKLVKTTKKIVSSIKILNEQKFSLVQNPKRVYRNFY